MKPELNTKDSTIDFSLFYTIMFYVLLIILGPITIFFVVKNIIFIGILQASVITSNVASAVAAVIMLHVIVGMYIYRAYVYSETTKQKPVKVD